MATILASAIIGRVSADLGDPANVRWTAADLIQWLNDAQREIAILRPDASVSVAAIALTANVSIQTLPTNAQSLIKLTRNVTGGLPITLVDHGELDRVKPDWHNSTAAAAVKNYTYDGKSPKTYYVYPRPLTAFSVEAHLHVMPAVVIAANTISVDDIYATAIYDYVVHRAKMKASDTFDNDAAEASYQRFLNRLGLKLQVDKSTDPHSPKSNPTSTTPAPPEARSAGAY